MLEIPRDLLADPADEIAAADLRAIVDELQGMTLYAWVGRDELGSGEIGIKRVGTRDGCLALCVFSRKKLESEPVLAAMAAMSEEFGNKLLLAEFRLQAIADPTGPYSNEY